MYGYEISISNPLYVFGDGQHETTRFLLYFLNRYVSGKSFIDAGCGTGILAIFASKRGAKSVIAIDCDDNAIECARENARTNNADISVIKADIGKDILSVADVVTANLARSEALYYLPNLTRLVNDNGLLITTWFKELPKDELTKRFEVIDRIEGVEYDCYVLKKI